MSTSLIPTEVLVACLCAQWCSVCREYKSTFERLEREFPESSFVWIDIEDQAELVDPMDVENFPTLLIARHHQALFFGPLLPQEVALRRLLQAQLSNPAVPPLQRPGLTELIQRIRNRLP